MFTLEEIVNDAKNGADILRLHKKYGGFNLYIPKQHPDYKERIKEEFNGYNYDSLAYKYNTTPKNVREIVKEPKSEEPSLFK